MWKKTEGAQNQAQDLIDQFEAMEAQKLFELFAKADPMVQSQRLERVGVGVLLDIFEEQKFGFIAGEIEGEC